MLKFSFEQAYLFNTGADMMSYNLLGAHEQTSEGVDGYSFAVWAPSAASVSVTGDFNGWDIQADPLGRMGSTGIFYGFVAGAGKWDSYKYYITSADGHGIYKADPYAFHSETRPGTSSKLYPMRDGFEWTDSEFIAKRDAHDLNDPAPLNIYELHLGSWKKSADGNFLNYRIIADELADYISDMGYTHIELMPVMEHPLDDSWGYQITGYFSPTSRFGTPADFRYFIDHMHSKGIGVILDWVPGHFPKDESGLGRFDGSALFEYADERLGEHKEWGTYVFNYAREEVRSFLTSGAFYWISEFHADGLRVDAVSSMLYLNYGRTNHVLNRHGGVENLESVSFLQNLNKAIKERFPGVMMVAEESTAWPKVTATAARGGLDFGFKWNMGWMHDTIDYFSRDYIYRRWHHSQLSFSLVYAFSERFILPLSHDEVVHGKASMIEKMPGDIWRKFSSLRSLYGYMMAHPGGKLIFMGSEFGQFVEWRFYEQLEWFMLGYEKHAQLQNYVRTLNRTYLAQKALWDIDTGWDGFQWHNSDDSANCIYSFSRYSRNGEGILVMLNMTPNPLPEYRVGIPSCGYYEVILDSDAKEFGGSDYLRANGSGTMVSGSDGKDCVVYRFFREEVPYNGFDGSAVLTVPPNSAVYLKKC
ncbi:MAG: 1,4-alpha-glucan branching protein GlgB [Saccharofermentanales bacterium]